MSIHGNAPNHRLHCRRHFVPRHFKFKPTRYQPTHGSLSLEWIPGGSMHFKSLSAGLYIQHHVQVKDNIENPNSWPIVRGFHWCSMDSLHKRAVMRKAFPCHGIYGRCPFIAGPSLVVIVTWHAYFHTIRSVPDSKVHEANMGPTCVLSAPDGQHVGPMNLAIRGVPGACITTAVWRCSTPISQWQYRSYLKAVLPLVKSHPTASDHSFSTGRGVLWRKSVRYKLIFI